MKKVKLCEIAKVITGGTPSTTNKDYWVNGTIPWLQSGVCQNCDVNSSSSFITQEGLKNSSAKMMPKDTVLIALTGSTTGKIGYLTFNACANQSVTGILPNDSFESRYLYYYLISKRKKILFESYGGAQKHISQNYIKNMTIPLLNKSDQRKVVKILSTLSNIMEAKKEEIAKLDLLIKARFVEMFGDPISNSKKYEIVPFSYFIEHIKYGASQPPIFSTDGKFKFIRATNIKVGRITEKDMLYISENEAIKLNKCKLMGNELIVVRSGVNAGDTCVVPMQYKNHYAGYDLIVSLDLNKANPIFFNELMNTNYMEYTIKPLTRRAAQPHLNAEQTKSLPMIKVALEKQNIFSSFVQQIDKSKVAVQKSLDEAQVLYDSLMQKYFD